MEEYQDITAINFKNIWNSAKGFYHDINTGDALPFKEAPYQINLLYYEWLKEEIAWLIEEGVIEETQSPWALPVVIVPKKEIMIDKKTGEHREILALRLYIS